MAPREDSSLLSNKHFDIRQSSFGAKVDSNAASRRKKLVCAALFTTVAVMMAGLAVVYKHHRSKYTQIQPTGPYELVECQEGRVRIQ